MSLRDQMLKAGLITEEQARQDAHKQRVETKRGDPKERARKQEAQREETRGQQEAERARHREQGQEQAQQQAVKEQPHAERQQRGTALEGIYRDGQLGKWEGARRYHYVMQGRIEWVLVSEDVVRKLEHGQAAIVRGERNPQRPALLTAAAARKLRELAPERVLLLHEA